MVWVLPTVQPHHTPLTSWPAVTHILSVVSQMWVSPSFLGALEPYWDGFPRSLLHGLSILFPQVRDSSGHMYSGRFQDTT